ncbi:SIMPL domain-containing protein [Streptomyces sp. NPDC101181]|uniref:SIMPL domain-containing protein n=1 Tax=Streptomyces sp. NPDC101181 TaxID=3366125 RepID=UPI0038137A89
MNTDQSIESPWGISVFGAASVDAAPDVARLRVAIQQTRQSAAEAFEVTRRDVNQVREVVRGHGVADRHVSASRLNLESAYAYRGNEHKFVGYKCTASFVIELRALDTLEAVLVDVVEAGANEVNGVEFDVRAKKELRAEARRAAVAAAREKAELYADAAGVRLGPVVHIQDVDSEQVQNNYRSHGRSAAGDGEGDLTPGRITVAAGVVVGFSIAEG